MNMLEAQNTLVSILNPTVLTCCPRPWHVQMCALTWDHMVFGRELFSCDNTFSGREPPVVACRYISIEQIIYASNVCTRHAPRPWRRVSKTTQ